MPPETPPRPTDNAAELIAWLGQYRSGGKSAEAAANKISKHFWPRFMRYFMTRGLTAAEAEELVQEALFKLFRHADSLNDARAFAGWAWSIARNVLIDDRRHPARDGDIEIDVDDATWESLMESMPAPEALHPTTRICLDRQLAEFVARHPERAFCLERTELDGWTLDMLAAHLERTYEATKEYLSQCRKILRKCLQVCFE